MMALISPEYAKLNAQLHIDRPDYGNRGHRFADVVISVSQAFDTRDVLDYGAGKQGLRKSLPMIDVRSYDPAIEEIARQPGPADIVCSFDVLEHIEPEYLDNVIRHIFDLSRKAVILNIATRPAQKFLADGRNAHLTVEPYMWWLTKLAKQKATLIQYNTTGYEEFLAVYSRYQEPEEEDKESEAD